MRRHLFEPVFDSGEDDFSSGKARGNVVLSRYNSKQLIPFCLDEQAHRRFSRADFAFDLRMPSASEAKNAIGLKFGKSLF